MTIGMKRSTVIGVTLALAVGVWTALAQPAGATHPRPKAASPLRVSLVPAYQQCTAANRTHGPPLAFTSCNPPTQASTFVTVGTPDANGALADSAGFVRLGVHVGAPGPPTDTEVLATAEVTDVRCQTGTSTCGNANSTGGPDYTGDLQVDGTLRITDHFNAVAVGGGTDPATVVDIPFPLNMFCSNTADMSVGAACTINTSTQPLIPDPCNCEGKQMVVEVSRLRVLDGGSDGNVSTAPNTVFATQGIFIP